MSLILTSESFGEGDYLGHDHVLSAAYGFGCSGGNLSPQLSWSGAPEGTQSYAVTCYDPDAPTGSGPCPPPGAHVHRYIFTVHAVSMNTLPVTADTSAAIVGFHLNFSTLAKASLIGLFKR